MSDEPRPPSSTLKGRLADVFVPALVDGAVEALSRRLGSRATIDDPSFGRASSLASVDPLIKKVSGWLAERRATYRHVHSTTGVDRDACEGVLALAGSVGSGPRELPIAVIAERRRLREIELRIYYAPEAAMKKARPALVPPAVLTLPPPNVTAVLEDLRRNAVERALGAFEEAARVVDTHGRGHPKAGSAMGGFLADLGPLDLTLGGLADDGRCCCVEATLSRGDEETPALFAFERGDSGLFRELRIYTD